MGRKTRRTQRAVVLGRGRATGRTRVDALVGALAAADPETRCMAALRMGRHGSAEILDALRERILADDLEMAACCRVALAVLERKLEADPALVPPPLAELQKELTSPYAAVRGRAARNLARLPAATALPVLVHAAQAESDGGVLGALLLAAGRLDAPGLVGFLLPYLKHHDDRVRACGLEACWGLMEAEVGHAALPLVKDGAPKVRAAGLVLLIRRGHETSRAMARTVLASQRLWMRLTALFALGGMNQPWAREMVIQHIRDTTLPPLVRAMAREATALAGAPVVARAESSAETVFTDLTRHLNDLPDAASFVASMDSSDPLMRVHGLQNAWRFAGPDVLARLDRQVELETDPLVLATLVKALARVGGGGRLAAIRSFLDHADERVRSNAVEALALAHEGPELREMLKTLLAEDEGARPRKAAAAQLFASDAGEAVAHFRSLLLGADGSARQGALSVISSVADDRLVPLLTDALRDNRREVHAPVVALLARSADWPAAGELLARFRKGEVAGEVIGDEPVSLLMAELNSARPADRVRAMGRLVTSNDLRVNTVLELNLSARDPEVAHEAARVLRERHRTFTLPGLYQRLAETYVTRTRAGHLIVTQEVAAGLPAGLAGDEEIDPEKLRWLGKAIYNAFEDEQEMDQELRAVCLDVRSALEQLGSIMSPVTRPERVAALTAQMRRDAARAGVDVPEEDEAGAEQRGGAVRAALRYALAMGVACAVLAGYLVWPEGEAEGAAGAGPGGSDQVTRMVDAMGLEQDAARFRSRFHERPVAVSGRLLKAADSHTADVRSGTVIFRLRTIRDGSIPAGLGSGRRCEVTGRVAELAPDGAIVVDGTLVPAKEN